ncbi:MAG: rod shape-determining protein MreD [Planctomycetota bacterium]|nr:rod shape-determining protein MreD [Planctomycetota bacterium]
MRWLLVAILAYACLVLQTAAFRPGGLAVPVDGHWARPDLVLLLGLFLALYLEPYEVFVVGWCLGLASDVVSVSGRLGVQALLVSLVLTGLSHGRGAFRRTRVLTQFLLAFGVVAATHLLWYLATRYLEDASPAIGRSIEQALLDALYAAVLAPYLFWVLERLRRALGVADESREG